MITLTRLGRLCAVVAAAGVVVGTAPAAVAGNLDQGCTYTVPDHFEDYYPELAGNTMRPGHAFSQFTQGEFGFDSGFNPGNAKFNAQPAIPRNCNPTDQPPAHPETPLNQPYPRPNK